MIIGQMMKFMLIWLFSFLMGFVGHADNDIAEVARLQSYFRVNGDGNSRLTRREIAPVAFTLGDSVIPVLVEGLAHSDEEKADIAAECLAVIGGPKAVAALRAAYNKAPRTSLKALLCFSLATTGSDEDVDFLIQSLEGEHFGDTWYPIEVAGYALGVLRIERAREALQRTAAKEPASFASSAAQEALRWMDEGPWETPEPTLGTPGEAVMLAVLRHGVPRTSDKRGFHDPDQKCRWNLKGKSWVRMAESDYPEDTPFISFDVLMGKDDKRALCSVSLHFGPLNASGYDFILKRKQGEWTVVAMRSTWVS